MGAIVCGPRTGRFVDGEVMELWQGNKVLQSLGTFSLWFGWYGFNAGSAVAADVVSSNAFVATTLSAGVGLCMWALIELILRGKPSILGMCSGAVAGLATITPASGFVSPTGASITSLTLNFSPTTAYASVGSMWIGVVPAPGSVALLGAAALIGVRRRRA
jgi:Amt family ammonium transporter